MRRPLLLLGLTVLIASLLPATRAFAHQSSVTYSSVTVDDEGGVSYQLQLSTRDLFEALALDRDRDATDEEIRAGQARLFTYVSERLRVADGERACPLTPASEQAIEIVQQNDRFVKLRLTARCGAPIQLLAIDYDLFFDLDAAHLGIVQVTHAGETVRRELAESAARFEWELGSAAPESMGFVDFIESGVEHIFTGYDHICFLIGLLLVATVRARRTPGTGAAFYEPRDARDAALLVLKTVTAFTVAHSLTLIAAALGWFELPSRLVESTIAASIVYVAAENVLTVEPKNRWPLAFGFGLVHGMGFASLLRPLLPPTGVVPSLLAFNLGVELGQLSIVAVVLPLLVLGARRSAAGYRRFVVVGGSAVIGLFGLLWLIDRVFDVKTISRWL